MNLHFHAWDNIFSTIKKKKQKVPPESKAFTYKRDVFQYDCYDSMNPVLLPEKQGTTILLQLHVSIQQSGELLLYRYPLFALILSAVHPFAVGWISDFSGWFCGVIRFFLFRLHFFCFLLTMPC